MLSVMISEEIKRGLEFLLFAKEKYGRKKEYL